MPLMNALVRHRYTTNMRELRAMLLDALAPSHGGSPAIDRPPEEPASPVEGACIPELAHFGLDSITLPNCNVRDQRRRAAHCLLRQQLTRGKTATLITRLREVYSRRISLARRKPHHFQLS